MKSVSTFRRNFTLLFLLLSVIVSVFSYIVVTNIVGSRSHIQQEAMAPIFNLVDEKLLRPLHMTQALAASDVFVPLMTADPPDHEALKAKITALGHQLKFNVFVALDSAGMQYFASGKVLSISRETTPWYHRFIESESESQVVLGNEQELSLYLDFKEYDAQDRFIGVIGADLSLNQFMQAFERYQRQYGYEFYFADDEGNVLLSSDAEVQPRLDQVTSVTDLSWYQQLNSTPLINLGSSNLVTHKGKEQLVVELPLPQLNWQAYITLPFDNQSGTGGVSLWRLVVAIFLVVVFLCLVILFFTESYSERFQQRLFTDSMTGIANRRYLERLTEQLKKTKVPVSLIIADIDHFKAVNDNYGHNAGDMVIKRLGEVLKSAMREQDVAARWGGEEFVLLLPRTAYEQALEVAERLRKQVAKTAFTLPDGTELHITASFGVTQSEEFESLADLVRLADRALYNAKHKGRNRIEGHLPSV